ncbi:MAG: FkbM family methyltransferase [Chitinophagaceae bacterium]
MSRFSTLKKHLSLKEAFFIYTKMKTGQWNNWKLKKLYFPFSLRNNPYDYATFEEVLLREDYNLDLGFTPKTIIDAGANIGLTSVYLASKYPTAKIVSLEPENENFQILAQNAAKYENIKPVKAGVWNKKAFLVIKDNGGGNNAFTVEEVSAENESTIKAFSIAAIMQQNGWHQIDFLKMDIEGSEKIVFESDFESWLPFTRVLVIELHERMVPGCSAAVFSALNKYQFSWVEKGENIVCNNEMLD